MTNGEPHSHRSRRHHRQSQAYEIALMSPLRSSLFLLALVLPALLLVFETGRIVIAENLGESVDPAKIRQAITLDSVNPELHFQLGKILLLTGDSNAQVVAEQEFRNAVAANPNAAVYWAGLAKACYSLADQSCADSAFRRAQQMAPSSPEFAWQAAVNAVVSNQPQKAVGYLKTFVRLQPAGVDQAFQLLMRGFNSPDLVWRAFLGNTADPASKLHFLDYLAANSNVEVADALWQKLAAEKTPLSQALVIPYVDRLLVGGHFREAAAVWSYANTKSTASRGSALDPIPDPGVGGDPNLVFNSGFEQDPLNAGFDWHYAPQPYLTLDFSDAAAHSGKHALRAEFTVPQNSEYEVAYQFVPVTPNQTYEVSGFAKSQSIGSDSGPRLRVSDPKCASCLDVATSGVVDTSPWHRLTARFTTGPTTDVVRLSIWRPRGRSYPMEISGTAWFDDISLLPVDDQSQQAH